jgi:hypothetical protein
MKVENHTPSDGSILLKCDGECSKIEGDDGCRGDVKKVHVSGNGFKKPFEFNYCQEAIDEDLNRGFSVDVISEQEIIKALNETQP